MSTPSVTFLTRVATLACLVDLTDLSDFCDCCDCIDVSSGPSLWSSINLLFDFPNVFVTSLSY